MRKLPVKIINFTTGFLLLSSIHCTIMAVFSDAPMQTFFNTLIYLPIIILLSISEKKVKYFWQYLVCAAAVIGIVYAANDAGFERIISILLVIAASLSYFAARSKKVNCWLDKPDFAFLGIYLGMYLLELRFESELLKNYAIIGAGFYYLLCIYQTNIQEMQRIIEDHAELERFPVKRLLKNNYLMMGIQTIMVAVGMCIAPFFGIDGLFNKIIETLRNVIAWLLRGLEAEEVEWGETEAAGEAALEIVQETEMSPFREFLLMLWEIFSWIIVITITVYAIYRILRYLYQLYLDFDMRSVENGDQIEQIHLPVTKEEKKKLRKEKQESLFWDRSPNARIRKYYKKRVLKDLKEAPKPSMTPEEIEQGVMMGEEEKSIFHIYYEKARYGKDGCTKEEALKYKF